ncbi:MAG: EF-P lysine aminoacylase GenX [Planctomycetes bacterium]|nr:EF-P lysine aminoacylase GenX [Planctomycetota bacterium]
MSSDRDFLPSADWPTLRLRAELLTRTRRFFDERGFLEVETPLLSSDTVVDRHIDPLSVVLFDDARRPEVGRRMWLQTSPEFHMKRLLAAGAEAIYQITRSFRGGETGRLHNPEFTMVEWYRRGDGMREGIELLSALCETLLARVPGARPWVPGASGAPPQTCWGSAPLAPGTGSSPTTTGPGLAAGTLLGPAEVLTYREAFERHAGIDPHACDVPELRLAAVANGCNPPPSLGDDRDGWLDLMMAELVAPRLGRTRPAIVCDYPARQAALAVVRNDNPPVAERFELLVDGIELANGYHELTDAAVLRKRIAIANQQRTEDGKPTLPTESRLLQAMEHGLPASSGCALGFDRVVMLAAGAKSIEEVMAFPGERA